MKLLALRGRSVHCVHTLCVRARASMAYSDGGKRMFRKLLVCSIWHPRRNWLPSIRWSVENASICKYAYASRTQYQKHTKKNKIKPNLGFWCSFVKVLAFPKWQSLRIGAGVKKSTMQFVAYAPRTNDAERSNILDIRRARATQAFLRNHPISWEEVFLHILAKN